MGVIVHEDFRFIVQGITGREALNFTRECLQYGSKIVGGVTPGKGGREVYGVPVYDTVAEIVARERVDGAVITVPLQFAPDAAFEAIDAGIKEIVIITEGIPRKDAAAICEFADQHGARMIGPNCLGLITPEVCRFGSLGGPAVDCRKAFQPGVVGVMSRSGGMTTEIANALTASGLGVSTAISIGGDPVIGSTYADLMPLFEADEDTQAVVIYSEPGGTAEAELAKWSQENKSRLPIVAFVAGRFMDDMPGMSFGHAGTVVEKKVDSPADKIRRMREAGIAVADEIGDIPKLVRERIGTKGSELTMGMFIDVAVDDAIVQKTEGLAAKLVEVCPVNIFAAAGNGVQIVEDNVDECTLCDLCTQASPDGVKVVKLYE